MAVFRVEKTRDYTVMANYHLKDRSLSLKAKGLLSLILSLPDNWKYSIRGFASLNSDGIDAVRSAIRELENAGFITRYQIRDESGHFTVEYVVREKPVLENPTSENPTSGNPISEKPMLLNTDKTKTKQSNTNGIVFYPGASPTDFARIIREWNDVPMTLNIETIKKGTKRYRNTNKCIGGDIEKFISTIRSIPSQGSFLSMVQNGDRITYDWFVDPDNFQRITEGTYRRERKQKMSVFERIMND